jgi:hypothetical protein
LPFSLDHVWIAAANRDAALEQLSAATGLPVQDAWAPGGVVRSRGVRFANGPFLDVHSEESGSGAMVLLRGALAEAEALAAERGWAVKASRREEVPADRRPPWSLLFFRRGQGALSRLAVIDYVADPRGYPVREYDQPLLHLDSAPAGGPRLTGVAVGGGGDLAAFGCCELSVAGADGAVRLEVRGADAPSISVGPVEVRFSA